MIPWYRADEVLDDLALDINESGDLLRILPLQLGQQSLEVEVHVAPARLGVVYPSTADNSIGPKTWYNAPSHHTLEGAMPWCRIFFTTNSLCWRSYGSASCCISLGPSQACPPHPCRPSPSASVLPSPKRSRA